MILLELNKEIIYKALKAKGINSLYHANTVATSCTFLRNGGLLSRGAVEHKQLFQTTQDSDDIDKKFNVWNDIFLDSIDLHGLFPRQNHYGPVLFKINVDILNYELLPPIWITRDNPTRWEVNEDHYFETFEEFDEAYDLGNYREMITLRNTFDPLPFVPYLEEIIVDDPQLKLKSDGTVFITEAVKALKLAMKESSSDYSQVIKKVRTKCVSCYCLSNYSQQHTVDDLKKKFLPL